MGHQAGKGGASEGPTLEKITAPYNFVPLSRKVFFPDWADQVSHDLPFSDGISGELVCELTTHTPVYVRNGGKWEHAEVMTNLDAQSFFYVKEGEKRHFMIPGTTLKGMLRNVIEIASFGKMGKVDDHRYGVRDLQNPNLYGKYLTTDLGGKVYKPLSNSGWLLKDKETGELGIVPCSCARVDHTLLQNSRLHLRQSSLSKYEIWGENRLKVQFDCTAEMPHAHSGGKKLVYRKVTNLSGGSTSGTLVFTGQPSPNDGRPGKKHMEFVFFNEEPGKVVVVPRKVQQEFQFIHSDANEVPNEEWGYWKQKLAHGCGVPVFYLTNKDGSLHSLGLAQMYRLPYANSVRQAIKHSTTDHFHPDPDLAETIFGYVDGSSDALKGRVAVSPAVATHAAPMDKPVQTVLGGPKPSFYPNYMEQPNSGGQYQTFMDSDCRVRGWKRYPVRPIGDISTPKGVTDKVDTKLIPLKEKAKFTFRVKLHNLKPVELGAVAWALTWGNNETLRHSLGMGKSMGYGQATIAITSADVGWQDAVSAFVARMDREVGGSWKKTAQLEQLLGMADPAVSPQCGSLQHLFLAPGKGNEFVNAKKEHLALLPHVKPTAVKDADRFKALKPREHGNALVLPAGASTPVPPVSAVVPPPTVIWAAATLTFDNGRGILKAVLEGKNATCGRTPEVDPIIAKIKKKGYITSGVTVELIGGNNYKIVKVEPLS